MVRKTKTEAQNTRQSIINAAREVFVMKGVSKTSLEQIAEHAGVTRGAVYWHFKNKAELFHAMREQVFLPLIDKMDDALLVDQNQYGNENQDPLTRIENALVSILQELSNCQVTQQTYIIMMSKCEYVDEFATVLQEILNNCADVVGKIERVYELAQQQGLLYNHQSPPALAMDTHLFFSGLLQMWVRDIEGSKFRDQANNLIKAHIQMRRKNNIAKQ